MNIREGETPKDWHTRHAQLHESLARDAGEDGCAVSAEFVDTVKASAARNDTYVETAIRMDHAGDDVDLHRETAEAQRRYLEHGDFARYNYELAAMHRVLAARSK